MSTPKTRRILPLLLTAFFFLLAASSARAQVVISQVYGAGGNSGALRTNDYVELFNRGSVSVSLSGYSIQYASASGSGNFAGAVPLSGSIAPGQYYLVRMDPAGANGVPLPTADATGTIAMAAGAGKVVLVNSTTGLGCNGGSAPCNATQLGLIVDLVGYGAGTNFFEGTGPTPTTSTTLAVFRANGGCTDSNSNAADFATATPNPRNTASPTAPCSGAAVTIAPTGGNTAVSEAGETIDTYTIVLNSVPTANVVISITADAQITVGTDGTTFLSTASVTFTPANALTPQTIFVRAVDDDTTEASPHTGNITHTAASGDAAYNGIGIATVVVQITDDDVPVTTCGAAFTPIYQIQGSGATAAITGIVTTEGIVIGDYEGPSPALRGFYIQDATGDGDAATSDGIFVFNGGANNVVLGEAVRVTGSASEFQGQTQISATTVGHCGTTGEITPVDLTLPFPSADYLERFEGMLVRLPQTLFVTDTFQLGRFGEVDLSSGGRLVDPTNVVAPGGPANAMQQANNLNRIIVDDAPNEEDPDPIVFARNGLPLSASNTLRGGDTATGIVGVMTFTWAGNAASGNAYRVRPINALNGVVNFTAANARPAVPPSVGGTLRVASANVLNYFNTFGTTSCTFGLGGGVAECRGADNVTEFNRQATKVVAALLSTGADVIGVSELENDGYGLGSAIQNLIDRLNTETSAGAWAFIDADTATGQVNALGTDAIKVGVIYRTVAVTPIGATAALNTVSFVTGGDSGPRNRPALAQAFQQNSNGATFVIVVNHLKSKGSACDAPDAGDGQSNCSIVRTNAANEMAAWLAGDPTVSNTKNVVILGDLNAHTKEAPVVALESAGYVNVVTSFVPTGSYSYSFDGQWGELDHVLASRRMSMFVSGATVHHINADEPVVLDYNTNFKSAGQIAGLYAPDQFRASDHDPVVIGLNLCRSITGTAGRETLLGTSEADCITGDAGADTLTGGGGADLFIYLTMRDTGDTITDFVPGEDRIDLSVLLQSIGFNGGDALATGWVKVIASGTSDSIVQIDQDGPGTAQPFRSFLVVRNVAPTVLAQAANFIF